METWYEINRSRTKITEVKVIRSTDKSIWMHNHYSKKETRAAIRSEWYWFVRTFDEAKSICLQRLGVTIDACKRAKINHKKLSLLTDAKEWEAE